MRPVPDSLILRETARFVFPLIQLFALYVLFHGHYSPGGGFQGGVMIAASYLLIRLSHPGRKARTLFPHRITRRGAAAGALLFLALGLPALLGDGSYLAHEFLDLAESAPDRHSLGILLIEVGVAIACATALVAIHDDIETGDDRGTAARG